MDLGRLHLLKREYNQMTKDFDHALSLLKDLNLPFYYNRMLKEIINLLKQKGRAEEAKIYSKMMS